MPFLPNINLYILKIKNLLKDIIRTGTSCECVEASNKVFTVRSGLYIPDWRYKSKMHGHPRFSADVTECSVGISAESA